MVLLIMSILLAAGINLLMIRTEAARVDETRHKMEVIQNALAAYLAEYRRLPCPAFSSLPVNYVSNFPTNGPAFGIENLTAPGVCGATSVSNGDPDNGTMGAVPTTTLQIDDDYQFDGWNRRIDYNVNQLCTSPLYSYGIFYKFYYVDAGFMGMLPGLSRPSTSSFSLPVSGTDAGFWTVNNTANFNYDTVNQGCTGSYTINDATGHPKTTSAVFVLVSHGKDGHGAYSYAGVTNGSNAPTDFNSSRVNAGNSDPDKDNNAHMDGNGNFIVNHGVFVQKSPVYTSTTPYVNFDDIVVYETKSQLLANAGVMKGMAGQVTPPVNIDPVCNMIDKKLGPQAPAVVSYPNPPLLASAQAICGTTALGGPNNYGMCAQTFYDLATELFFYCY